MPTLYYNNKARVVTRVATHICGIDPYGGLPCNVPSPSTGRRIALIPVMSETLTQFKEGFNIYEIEFDKAESVVPTNLIGEPCLSGGVPALYDGSHMSELGFHYYPWIEDALENHDGALTTLSTYQWCAVYEWRDAKGLRHQSAPSVIWQVHFTDAAHDGISLQVATLQLTEHCDDEDDGSGGMSLTPPFPSGANWPVDIVVYRTTANGSTFYRDYPTTSAMADDNDNDSAYITHYSTISDTTLESNEILYTDGGVLVNAQPPAARHIVQHDRHMWLISRDDPTLLWVSKQITGGYEVPGFPLQFVMRHDEGGGHVALASMGTQLLAFKDEGVYVYAGSPPNDLGQGGNLSGPYCIAPHTGSINPRSVVECPGGVAFQSKDSIWFIDTGMQAKRIGGPVEDLLNTYPYCQGATLDQRRELLFFAMTTIESPTVNYYGITLAWHYRLNEWTVLHFPPQLPATDHGVPQDEMCPAVGAAMCWRGGSDDEMEYHQLQPNGTVIHLSESAHLDHDGSPIRPVVSTAWIQVAGIAGFQRVRRMHLRGTELGDHSLLIRVAHDFEDMPWAATRSFVFNGVDEYIYIGNEADLDFLRTDHFTASAWVKTTSAAHQTICGKYNTEGWRMYTDAGLLHFQLAGPTQSIRVSGSTVVNDGVWHHVLVTYRGTSVASGVSAYIDGRPEQLTTEMNTLSNNVTTSAAPFNIAASAAATSPFNGFICQVSVWDDDMSLAEALEIWNGGRPGLLEGTAAETAGKLIAWWQVGASPYETDMYPYVQDGYNGYDGLMFNLEYNSCVVDVPSADCVHCWGWTEMGTVVEDSEEHVRCHIARQKTKAVRFEVTTQPKKVWGLSMSTPTVRLEGIGLDIGVKKGLYKVRDAGSK